MASGVYIIRNTTNDKCYIGSSVNITARWSSHVTALKAAKHPNPHLQAAWLKNGEGAFIFSIAAECLPSGTIELEQTYLDAGLGDYNIARDAKAPWLGVRRSPETRAKISRAQIGTKQSEKTIEHRIQKLTGQVRTDVQKQRMRYAAQRIGQKPSTQCLTKLSAYRAKTATRIIRTDSDGFILEFPSMTVAMDCGFHITSIKKAARHKGLYRGFLWDVIAPEKKPNVDLSGLQRANARARKPIQASYPDGSLRFFDGVCDVRRKLNIGNRHVVHAIKTGKPYRGALWSYVTPSEEPSRGGCEDNDGPANTSPALESKRSHCLGS